MPRLKVFTTKAGFYELAVAAGSQAAALAAWGIHQNLFAHGMAQVATDKAIIAAALAKPGVVLKRPLGGKGAFAEDAALPNVKAAPRKAKPQASAAARKAAADAAEELDRAEREHAEALDALEARRAEVAAKLAAERAGWSARRKQLEQAGNRARRALRKKR